MVNEQGTLNNSRMSSKDWYKVLLEDNLTMEVDDNGRRSLIKCRAENQHPHNDWENSWRLARLRGLESDQISFLWRLLHNLLPTQSRISRLLQNQDNCCKLCHQPQDDLLHMFSCPSSKRVGQTLLRSLTSVQQNISPNKILLLSLELEPAMEFPVVWLVASTLLYVWNQRSTKKQCCVVEVRAVLEARINMLRRGKNLQNEATSIENLIENFS